MSTRQTSNALRLVVLVALSFGFMGFITDLARAYGAAEPSLCARQMDRDLG